MTLKNDTWAEYDNDQVSKQEFIQKITPDHLTISGDLSYDLRFDDGDLFGDIPFYTMETPQINSMVLHLKGENWN